MFIPGLLWLKVEAVKLYDAHNHLQDEWLLPHLDQIAADLTKAGIAGAVVNGTTPDDWASVSALASRFPWVVPSYGVHPWDCGNRPSDWQGRLESRLATEPRARVGEIGLDRWILDSAKPDDPRLAGLRRAPLAERRKSSSGNLSSPPPTTSRPPSIASMPGARCSTPCARRAAPSVVSSCTPTPVRRISCAR